jgi:hypothetical protein
MLVMNFRADAGRRADNDGTAHGLARWSRKVYLSHRKEAIMSNVVNLRQVRKTKARADKASQAEANRARFGRTKTQRLADAAEEQRRVNLLEGAKRSKQDRADDED